jgi:hypothetical protein
VKVRRGTVDGRVKQQSPVTLLHETEEMRDHDCVRGYTHEKTDSSGWVLKIRSFHTEQYDPEVQCSTVCVFEGRAVGQKDEEETEYMPSRSTVAMRTKHRVPSSWTQAIPALQRRQGSVTTYGDLRVRRHLSIVGSEMESRQNPLLKVLALSSSLPLSVSAAGRPRAFVGVFAVDGSPGPLAGGALFALRWGKRLEESTRGEHASRVWRTRLAYTNRVLRFGT